MTLTVVSTLVVMTALPWVAHAQGGGVAEQVGERFVVPLESPAADRHEGPV